MHFTIEHTFAITPADYEALYFDEPFQIALCDAVKLGRTLLKLEKSGDTIVRHVRIEPARDIPGPIAKLLGDKRFSYVEEIEFELGKGRGRWRTIPNIVSEKVDARGTIEMRGENGKTNRVVTGDIDVKVFGVGGIVERFVVAEVEKSYADAAAFTTKWLAEKSAK